MSDEPDERPWPEPDPVEPPAPKKPKNPRYSHSPDRLRKKERDKEGARLRTHEALSWDSIADRLGYSSKSHAYNQITKYIRQHHADQAETFRQVEEARFEDAIDVLMKIIRSEINVDDLSDGDSLTIAAAMDLINKDLELKLKAMVQLVNISGMRGKMWGFHAPTQVETSGSAPFAITVNPNLLPPQAVKALGITPSDE